VINILDVIPNIISPRYKQNKTLSDTRQGLADKPILWSDILNCFSDITYDKEHFRQWIQQFITQSRAKKEIDLHEDIDEFMSSIEDNGMIDVNKIPESLKTESRTIDQIVHFYIGLVWWHRSAKNDNFRHRRVKDDWYRNLPDINENSTDTDKQYWEKLFLLYDTNGFYYQRARDHIRQWKQKFHIPLHARVNYHTNDTFAQEQVVHSALMHIIQDTQPSRMKLTLHQSDIVQSFSDLYSDRVRKRIHDSKSETSILDKYRSSIDKFTWSKWSKCLWTLVSEGSIGSFKETIYRIDRWLRYEFINMINKNKELADVLHQNITIVLCSYC